MKILPRNENEEKTNLIVTSLNWPDWSRKSKSVESFSGQILLLGFGFGWVNQDINWMITIWNFLWQCRAIELKSWFHQFKKINVKKINNPKITWACPDCWTSFPSIVISQRTVSWIIVTLLPFNCWNDDSTKLTLSSGVIWLLPKQAEH